MGSSPSADIFFGVYLGSEGSWENDPDYEELPEFITDGGLEGLVVALVTGGLTRPAGRYDSDDPEWTTYHAARREALDECPVDIYTGSYMGEYAATCFGIKASHSRAYSYSPTNLTEAPIHRSSPGHYPDAWVEQLKKWAKHLGLPWEKIEAANPDGPRWMVVLSYG